MAGAQCSGQGSSSSGRGSSTSGWGSSTSGGVAVAVAWRRTSGLACIPRGMQADPLREFHAFFADQLSAGLVMSSLHANTKGLLVRPVALNVTGDIVAAKFPDAVNNFDVLFSKYEATVPRQGLVKYDYETRTCPDCSFKPAKVPYQYLKFSAPTLCEFEGYRFKLNAAYKPTGNPPLSGQEMSIEPLMPLANVRQLKQDNFTDAELYIDIGTDLFEVVRIASASWTSGPINKVGIKIKLKLTFVLSKEHAQGSIIEALVLKPQLLQKQPEAGAGAQIIATRKTDITLQRSGSQYAPSDR